MQTWILALLLLGCGGTRKFVECNDTASCRAQQAERAREFTKLVDKERTRPRLDFEQVANNVLLSRKDGRVLALDPALVELDLATGKERWRAEAVSGDTLWLAGDSLAVGRAGGRLPASVNFVDIKAERAVTSCPLALPAPKEADRVSMHVFDGDGGPHVFWSSAWYYEGGIPPGPEQQARTIRARACGVVALELPACKTTPRPLKDFVWDPPEGRRSRPGDPDYCGSLSPLIDLPLAAASAAPAAKSPAGEISLAVTESQAVQKPNSCGRVIHVVLEARDASGKRVWSHPLADRVFPCPRP